MEVAQAQDELEPDMSRRPATFTKADLARAMAVARENGMTVKVEPDGSMLLIPVPAAQPVEEAPIRSWVL